MTPITPEVGHITTPAGSYMIVASIVVMIGAGIYSLINFLKRNER